MFFLSERQIYDHPAKTYPHPRSVVHDKQTDVTCGVKSRTRGSKIHLLLTFTLKQLLLFLYQHLQPHMLYSTHTNVCAKWINSCVSQSLPLCSYETLSGRTQAHRHTQKNYICPIQFPYDSHVVITSVFYTDSFIDTVVHIAFAPIPAHTHTHTNTLNTNTDTHIPQD